MQLQPDLWIEGVYHVDFSPRGELRIVGRGDHLYLGLAGIARDEIDIESVEERDGVLHIIGRFSRRRVTLLDPVVRSIRQVRSLVERAGPDRTFAELVQEHYRL